MIKDPSLSQNIERKTEKRAVWENRHGYQNKMADDEWASNGNKDNWNTYNYNTGWNEQNPTINYSTQPTYATQTTRQQPREPNQNRASPKKDGFSSLFIAETSFPSWED